MTSGTWNAGIIAGTYGGTGVNNGANTLTYSGSYTLNQSVNTAAGPTFALGVTIPSIIHSGTTAVGDIGSTGSTFATVYATTFSGVSTTAKYADLAENYQADQAYAPGTVLMFGGSEEVTSAIADSTRIAGVVSTNPAHLMNSRLQGDTVVAIALQGRVPCKVVGPVEKGDMLVSAGSGYAKVNNSPAAGQVIGKAVGEYLGNDCTIVEIVVGRL